MLPMGTPVAGNKFLHNSWEHIFHLTKTGKVSLDRLSVGVPSTDKSNQKRYGDVHCLGNVWYIPYPTTNGFKNHPAMFPPDLPKKCILLHGIKKRMVVLDPFVGIGNTFQACKELSVEGIGIELDNHYCKEARKYC